MVLAHDIESGKRTKDVKTSNDVMFNTMLLSQYTLEGLKYAGFYKPSPIQLHGIPLGKCGFDLLLEAKSGTGKTLVFSIIALEKLNLNLGLQCVILAPTREIAHQICEVIREIGHFYSGLCVESVIGGLDIKEDIKKFKKRNVHIVVGSPGRLRHLIQENFIDVTQVKLIVLDEADKLIGKSFQSDINFIFASLPVQKQVIMSSATYSKEAKEFIDKYVSNVQLVCPDSTSILLGINQQVTFVKYNSNVIKQTEIKYTQLTKILSKHSFKQCLVFCNYQARVDDLHKMLNKDEWPAEKLHGQQEQTDRLDALKTLQDFKCRILISTDLAARGIDASNVDLVINFEAPLEWQTYLHRIGRAGRYGSYGTAITIISEGNADKRFKQTLSSFSDSLNIIEMDTGNKYDLKCNDDKQDDNKLLTEDNKDTKQNLPLDNTDQLWKELNEVPSQITNISTFEELMESFIDASAKLILDSSENSSFYDINQQFNSIDLSNSFVNLNNEKGVEDKNIESENELNCKCKEKQNDYSLKNGDSDFWCSNSKQIHINDGTKVMNSSHSNDNDPMAYMGLPAEFGKSMNKNKPRLNSQSYNMENQEFSSAIKTPHNVKNESYETTRFYNQSVNQPFFPSNSRDKNSRKKEHGKNTIKAKHKLKTYRDHALDVNTNRYPDNESQTVFRCPRLSSRDQESFKSSASSTVSNRIHKSSNSHTGEEYINWYNALKFRTKQIEMFYYINEMSKN